MGDHASPGTPRRLPPSVPPRAATPPPPRTSTRPPGPARPTPRPTPRPRRRRGRRFLRIVRALVIGIVVVALVTAGVLWWWVGSRLQRVEALSGAPATAGQTYLIVGSDARDSRVSDGTSGARTDTIIVIHQPESGPTAMISLPRDSYVAIPGYGSNKINAAYAFGGAPLLVETVEQLTGFTIDAYFEIGFDGVASIVDAVGGVELCHDADVDDWRSGMVWSAGCHTVDGDDALAFTRMRYSDPIGDIGRTQRQQQLISVLAGELGRPATVANPVRALQVASAGLDTVWVSEGTSVPQVVRAAFVMRSTQGDDAVTGTPPIVSLGHRVEGVGSTVLLDADSIDEFWAAIAAGDYPPGTVVGGFGSS